ncbi:Arc family DNA-binding protein [Enterobacter cancerogenus]|uniref:Arc family DNA-binding protein n=1 Tax=Enterobacter cancerogenus TaxID=69218 RepID=UPI0023614C13|nr:Arc family DNA-binding protein [Enterobacter cancerogenus]
MKGTRSIAPFGLRMPDDLKERVATRATLNGRSMNAEIIQILEDVVAGNDAAPEISKIRQENMALKLMLQIQERTIEILQQAAFLDDNPKVIESNKKMREHLAAYLGDDIEDLIKKFVQEASKSDEQ